MAPVPLSKAMPGACAGIFRKGSAMLGTETAELELPAKRNSMICPCCLQFVEDAKFLVDPINCTVTNGGKRARFTRKQFRLVKYLLDCFPLLATKEGIYDNVYLNEFGEGPDIKIIDVTVCMIRPALADVGLVIQTVWGRGYKIVEADPSQALLIKDRSIRDREIGSHRRWSKNNDSELLDLMRRKMTVTQCAAIMRMPYMTVQRHFQKLSRVAEAGAC